MNNHKNFLKVHELKILYNCSMSYKNVSKHLRKVKVYSQLLLCETPKYEANMVN